MGIVVSATPVSPGHVEIRLENGISGVIDISDLLWGEMFEPLRDPEVFATATLDPLFGALVSANGADVSPELLCERVRAAHAVH